MDPTEVFFVLVKGSMKWIIEDVENEFQEFIMEPGDMIYIPKGSFHNPIPYSPRIGLSIGFVQCV